MTVTIRPATPEDAATLQEIERLAGQRFHEVGLSNVAEDEPPSVEVLTAYANEERSWVADDGGRPCGYILVDEINDYAHIEQVTVRPDYQGRGIGRALINRAEEWAIANGRAALTLTTFTDVPWNRPLYEHLGFRVLSDDELGPELTAVRIQEAEHGFDPATRVVMRRDVRKGTADSTSTLSE